MRVWMLMLAASLLVGCTSNESDDPADPVAPRDLLASADEAALEWASDAKLAAVFGFEQAEASPTDEDGEPWGAYEPVLGVADENPGDGLANAWIFAYTSSNGTRDFIVSANGDVDSVEAPDLAPMSDAIWSITPGEAATVAFQEQPGLFNASLPGAYIEYALLEVDGVLQWQVGALGGEEGDAWFERVDVDARTGEPITAQEEEEPEPVAPDTEGNTVSGSYSAPASSDEATFQINASGHAQLDLETTVSGTLGEPTVTLEGPGRNQTDITGGGTIDMPAAGTYTITVDTDLPDNVEYSVNWCAHSGEGC